MTKLVRLFGFLGSVCVLGFWGQHAAAESTPPPNSANPSPTAPTSAPEPSAAETPPPAHEPTASTETSLTPAEPATGATSLDGATYRVRLRDLEQRVDELKEKIRQSHTRLSLLSDTILSGASGGAKAEIVLENDLSGAWRLIEAVVVFDGAVQYKKTDDTGVLAAQRRIPIFTGSIPSGDHTVQILLKLRGHGFGVFSYLRGIEATVKNDYSFTLTDGKLIELRAIAWEQGGPTTPVEEQPAIRFVENIRGISGGAEPSSPPATPLASPPASGAATKAPAPAASPPAAPPATAPPKSAAPKVDGAASGALGAGTP